MPEQLDWLKTSGAEPGDINVQGSDAWRSWRGKGLGSSDAPVLLGWSPWKTIEELVKEKRGVWKQEFGFAQQRAMDRGKALEPVIRNWYEKNCAGGNPFPDATAEDPDHAFMRASFDGIHRTIMNADFSKGRVLEIKAPNAKDHELARQGFIPEKYEPQVQWLLMIARLQWADYVSYGTDDTYAVVSMRADPLMQAELMSRALWAWDLVQNPEKTFAAAPWTRPIVRISLDLTAISAIVETMSFPGVLVTEAAQAIGEIPTIAEQETEALCAETLEAQAAHVAAEARYEALKERLKKALGDRPKAYCGEAVLEWQEKKGNIDYAKVPELKGVDLELYRKPKTKSFLFTRRDPGQ